MKEGEWVSWHRNGQRKRVENFVHDKRQGVSADFDEQGRKLRETTWRDDRKHGPEIEYDENGTVKAQRRYESGKLVE